METMHFHIHHTIFVWTISFRIQGVPINNLKPMKNCPGERMQGSLNWMLGYKTRPTKTKLSLDMGFPTMWQFEKCILRKTCAASC